MRRFPLVAALAAALTLTGCNTARLLFGLPEPTVVVAPTALPLELPFREGPGGLVLLKARVNDRADTEFILDTGAPVTVLMAGPATASLALDTSAARKLGPADDPAAPIGDIQPGFTIDFGGVRLTDLTAVVIPTSTLACRERYDSIGFGGVVGAHLFKRFVVEIDHAVKRVRLHDPAAYVARSGATLPLTFRSGHIYAEATVKTAAGDTLPLSLHMDTGMNQGLRLVEGSHPAITMPATGEAKRACYVHGSVETRKGEGVSLSFSGLSAAVEPTIESRVGGVSVTRQGSVGIGFLKDYQVAIDYPGKRMILTPRG